MLDQFFFAGTLPAQIAMGSYEPHLVIASYFIAFFGAFTGLSLVGELGKATSIWNRSLIHISSAFALGSGIWAMHFVGMLAFSLNMPVTYDPSLTIDSMIFAVASAYAVLAIANVQRLTFARLILGAIISGVGIGATHYIGMAAMRMDAVTRYRPDLFLASVTIAIFASGAALWIVFALNKKDVKRKYLWRVLAALIMGAAICGMHYTGMAAAVITPLKTESAQAAGQSSDMLALAIIAIISLMFGVNLVATIVANELSPESEDEYPFPFKLLILSLALTIAAIVGAGGTSFYVRHEVVVTVLDQLVVNQKANQLAYTDVVTDRSLKMYALTNDPKWKLAYHENKATSDAIITQLERLTQSGSYEENGDHDRVMRLDAKNDHFLRDQEAQVLNLLDQGNVTEANALLSDKAYLTRRSDYIGDVYNLTKNATDRVSLALTVLAHNFIYVAYIGIMAVIILPILWFFSIRSLHQWRQELLRARQKLVLNQVELRKLVAQSEMSRVEALEAQQKAEKADASKTEFLANMSHELRTPMHAILNYSQMSSKRLSGIQDEKLHKYLNNIHVSGQRLMTLLNNLLNVSKVEAGGLEVSFQEASLHAALDHCLMELDSLFAAKALDVNITGVERVLDLKISHDPYLMMQVFINILSNAIKFSPANGTIDITYEKTDTTVTCMIANDGNPIPPDDLLRIFDKFYQSGSNMHVGGTGLGLSICRQIMELHHGQIWAENRPPKVAFFVLLPLYEGQGFA